MASRRGVLFVFVLIGLAMAVSAGAVALILVLAGTPPSVPANATVYLTLRAPFPESDRADVLSELFAQRPTLRETVDLLRRAKADGRVRTLVLGVEGAGAMWGQLQEVRDAVADFRSSGKSVTAHLEYGGAAEYFVASAADRVLIMPGGQLDLAGLATYEVFFRSTLDKIGVYPDLLHIGEYKTASNTFTERGFTPAHREMSRDLNREWLDQLVGAVAAGRGLSPADARRVVEGGPYTAEAALAAGLVDRLAYADEIDDDDPVRGTRRVESDAYARSAPGGSRGRGRIALLYATGTIASGKSTGDGATVGSETFNEWLRRVRVDTSVRAVVVRIDSPGGSAIASEAIWRELKLTRDVKPVIVSMGDVAASGGYYIAAPAHAIVAQPGTLTGSIGVVTGKYVVRDLLQKLGVGVDAVSEGRMAEIYSPFRPFTAVERARIEEQMQATYELFVSRVAEGRGRTAAEIDAVAKGRVWTGRQARELGLVDELGGLDAALRLARERARLDPAREVDLVVYPPKRSVYEILANPLGSSLLAGVEAVLRPSDARLIESAAGRLLRFRRGEPLALMPNIFWN